MGVGVPRLAPGATILRPLTRAGGVGHLRPPGLRLGLPSCAPQACAWGYNLSPADAGLGGGWALVSPGLRLGLPSCARSAGLAGERTFAPPGLRLGLPSCARCAGLAGGRAGGRHGGGGALSEPDEGKGFCGTLRLQEKGIGESGIAMAARAQSGDRLDCEVDAAAAAQGQVLRARRAGVNPEIEHTQSENCERRGEDLRCEKDLPAEPGGGRR